MPRVCWEEQLCVACEFVTIDSPCMDFLRSTAAGKYNGQRRTHSGSQADYDGSLGDGERGGVPLMRNAFGSGLWTNT
jgi:hypothetical protein